MWKLLKKIALSFLFFLTISGKIFSTETNHWETAVFPDSTWNYYVGTAAPPTDWYTQTFNDQSWLRGKGGIGYGDGDDATVIPACTSVFMRIKYTVTDTSVITDGILNIDYDDAFVAFLNGVEIARSAGLTGDHPSYDQLSTVDHEAKVYQGGKPETFFLPKNKLRAILKIGVNVLAIQVHNVTTTSSDLSAIPYLSFGISNTQNYFAATPGWFVPPSSYSSSNLPIIKIYTHGADIPDEPKISADMQVIDNKNGSRNYYNDSANSYNGKIGIEIRGSSSQMFPKKGYGVETQDLIGNNLNVKLLGMPKDNDWVLYAPYSDKTLLRNAISYNLGRKIQAYAPRLKFCELYINDIYNGVYGLVEKIKQDSNRVNIAKMAVTDLTGDAVTGGYLLKIDRGFDGTNGFYSHYLANNLYLTYLYVDPKPLDIQNEQKLYIQDYVAKFEDALNSGIYSGENSGYGKYADLESFAEVFIISEFTKNVDSYRLSTFFYKDRDSKGGKLKMGPIWDFDLSMGNADYYGVPYDYGWIIDAENGDVGSTLPAPFWWSKLLQDPAFQNKLKCKWTELRTTLLRTDSLNKYIDDNVALLDEARKRNFETFPIMGQYVWPNYQWPATYEEEISYLKSWIDRRIQWMDNNIPGVCDATGLEHITHGIISVSPNPFTSEAQFSINHEIIGNIEIHITDISGKLVTELNGYNTGIDFVNINWDGKNNQGIKTQSGIYIYTVTINHGLVKTGKLVRIN